MTRKDFELIAYAFENSRTMILEGEEKPQTAHEELLLDGWKVAVNEMANQLAKTNARFDQDRFKKACGM